MTKRIIETATLIEWGIHLREQSPLVVADILLEEDRFETIHELVFRAPDDGQLWRITYEWNAGACYNNITGMWTEFDSRPATPERARFEAERVEPFEVMVIEYRPAEGEVAATANRKGDRP